MNHTPGPWEVVPAQFRRHYSTDDYDVRSVNKWRTIASVSQDSGNGIEKSNARLIAAAPELLEALKGVEDVMRMYGDGMLAGPLARTIRAAIAKAEGI